MKTALSRRLFKDTAEKFAVGGSVVKPKMESGIASGMMPPTPAPTPAPSMPKPTAPMAGAMSPMPTPTPPMANRPMTGQEGAMLVDNLQKTFMENIDKAETEEELMDAMRTNRMTKEERVNELADIVGAEDAKKTPESVLMLLQPLLEQMNVQASSMDIMGA